MKNHDKALQSEGTFGERWPFTGEAKVQKHNQNDFFLNWNLRE